MQMANMQANNVSSLQVRLQRLKCTFTPALCCAVELKAGAFPTLNLVLFVEVREPQRNKQNHHKH